MNDKTVSQVTLKAVMLVLSAESMEHGCVLQQNLTLIPAVPLSFASFVRLASTSDRACMVV